MKKVLIALVVIVVVIAVGVFYVLRNMNSFVATIIEKEGSEVTRTSVSVSGVKLSLGDGRGSIKGLEIASPEGFEAKRAFSLDDITVDIDVKSLRDDPIVIDEIRIKAPVVYAEITEKGLSNIMELRKRVNDYGAGKAGHGGGKPGPANRIRIRKFIFEQGKIEVDASELGVEKRTIALPGITLENLGGSSGAAPGEIARLIFLTLTSKAVSEVASSETSRLIEEKLGGSIKEKAKDLLDKIGN